MAAIIFLIIMSISFIQSGMQELPAEPLMDHTGLAGLPSPLPLRR
jgi:hypothetical protein